MQVSINNIPYEIPSETTLDKILPVIGMESASGIAFAVNDNIVPQHEWKTFHLQTNDSILLIRAIQGG
jgi:sulfur carrier protein